MQPGGRRREVGNQVARKHKPDYWLLLLSAGLLAMGLIVLYSISPGLSAQKNVGENYYVIKQLTAIGLGLGAFIFTANTPVNLWRKFERPIVIAAFVVAIAVRVVGEQINGAYRWIQLGGMSFQAAELIKFALLIWLAGFLADRISNHEIQDTSKIQKPLYIVLGLIAVIVAFVQSDLGSSAVMVAMIAAMVFIAGAPKKLLFQTAIAIIIGIVLLTSTSSYRRSRLATFLNPARDCQAEGYQACQALIAVGSGGVTGLGLGKGVQAYGYLPESQNDSIFAIYAEKFGFLGVTVLLGLFLGFFSRLKKIIVHTTDAYSRLLVVGVLAWLSTQTLINIGAMTGMLPLKGITLPFISYGGTSLVFITAAIGIVFQISRYTSYSIVNSQKVEGQSHEGTTDRRRLRGTYNPGARGRN
jgi:cell division protein FtsW